MPSAFLFQLEVCSYKFLLIYASVFRKQSSVLKSKDIKEIGYTYKKELSGYIHV
jgi:hypothetical protein